MDSYFNQYRMMLSLRGLTDHTIKSYSTYIRAYLDYLQSVLHQKPEDVSWDEMRAFIEWLKDTRDLSDRTINTAISQLRFFHIYVLHQYWDPTQLPFRKFDTYLPFVPSRDMILEFLSSITDLKFRSIIALMYSSGLRSGEARTLHYEDISRTQMTIHIRSTKSRSDRYAILSRNALDTLTEYWFTCGRPKDLLFPSNKHRNGKVVPVSSQYLSSRIRAQEALLGWPHRLTAHSFRHAFATHLYENGTDIFQIKELMGHRSLNSTAIYIHLANPSRRNIKSPLDEIGGGLHE